MSINGAESIPTAKAIHQRDAAGDLIVRQSRHARSANLAPLVAHRAMVFNPKVSNPLISRTGIQLAAIKNSAEKAMGARGKKADVFTNQGWRLGGKVPNR